MSGDQSTYDIELEYDDIAAVAEAIGQEVTVLGHSYGGPIVIGAAARTDAIARVIAYEGWPSAAGSPPSYDIGDAAERIQALLDAGDRDGAVSVVFPNWWGWTRTSSKAGPALSGRHGWPQQRLCRENCAPSRRSSDHSPPRVHPSAGSAGHRKPEVGPSPRSRPVEERSCPTLASTSLPGPRAHGLRHRSQPPCCCHHHIRRSHRARPQSLTARRPATQTLKRPLKRAIRHPTSRHGASPSTVLETPRARRIGRTR